MAKPWSIIVAVARNGVIGHHNAMPWRLKDDMAFFRRTTTSNTVVMGRKTYDSLGGALRNRHNIVLTHSFGLFAEEEHLKSALSLAEGIQKAEKNCFGDEVFVIGGAIVYDQFASLVERYYVTYIDAEIPDGDACFYPQFLSDHDAWAEETKFTATKDRETGNEFSFVVKQYTFRRPKEIAARRSAVVSEHLNAVRGKVARNSQRQPRAAVHEFHDLFEAYPVTA